MIYFVTENYLKQNTSITQNVDSTDVVPLIKIAADSWVRGYLGTFFYQHLLTEYNAQTLTPDEVLLVQNYIQPAVAWRAATESTIGLSYQLKNKGIQTQSGDYSSSPEYKAIMFVHHHYRDRSDFYDNLLIEYLVANKSLFPQFLDPQNVDSRIKNKYCKLPNSFQSGINFI
jgi:hypothetical protein